MWNTSKSQREMLRIEKPGKGVKLNERATLGSKKYIQTRERTSAVEISESRGQKILAIKMSVAVNQQGNGKVQKRPPTWTWPEGNGDPEENVMTPPPPPDLVGRD